MVSMHESPGKFIIVVGFQLLEFPVQQICGKPKIVYYNKIQSCTYCACLGIVFQEAGLTSLNLGKWIIPH